MKLLFICTANSCRSILAEALLRHKTQLHQALSAGSQPSGELNPMAIATLRAHYINTDNLYSKGWDDLDYQPDCVITLCDNAGGEACPAYLGHVMRSHWGMADPAAAADDQAHEAFEQALALLNKRLDAFLALDFTQPKTVLAEQIDQAGALQ